MAAVLRYRPHWLPTTTDHPLTEPQTSPPKANAYAVPKRLHPTSLSQISVVNMTPNLTQAPNYSDTKSPSLASLQASTNANAPAFEAVNSAPRNAADAHATPANGDLGSNGATKNLNRNDSIVSNENSSNPPSASPAPQPQHKRVYQACIPCRRRKVKCDLGSVDNPSDPPCVRCRRESKECYFSATRRKRKVDDGDGSESAYGDVASNADEYIIRNARKRLGSVGSGEVLRHRGGIIMMPSNSVGAMAGWESNHGHGIGVEESEGLPLTPGGSVGRTQPLRRPGHRDRDQRNLDDAHTQLENPEAQDVMRKGVYGPHDALDLLYKATNMMGSPENPRIKDLSTSQPNSRIGAGTPTYGQRASTEERTKRPELRRKSTMPPPLSTNTADTDVRPDTANPADRMQDPGYKAALKAWSRFRFVRAGWFTPSEAIDYIEYYYKYLSPLTPISPPTFQDPGTHPTLLVEEPILTITLLTISTRYCMITGPGGHCRSHAIHEQLWTYLRGMIERCLWGQEAFGGGFCGSGSVEIHEPQGASTAPWRGLRKGSLRTLGTVESLMILTEWHPRALHFPPSEATDELMLPEPGDIPDVDDDNPQRAPGGVGGKRIESWLEPAWRSDRMCWMLLSTGMGLSYELGVFDNIDEMLAAGGDMARPEYEDEGYRLRASRIKKLLLIYVTQLAGRLAWTNMVPEELRNDPPSEFRKRRASQDFNSPGTNVTGASTNTFNYIPDLEIDDQIIYCWSGITTAMRIGNEKLFRSRKYTTDIIQSGKYVELLKDFQPMLSTWQKDFSRFNLPPYIRHILTIEYEYVRIYVNSLSLQAVVERSSANAGSNGQSSGNQAPLSPETQSYYGQLPLAHLGGFGVADQGYVQEVVEGSRNLLRTVVEGLLPGNYLKHAPVRTYFRIISGAMFLLKTFAIGASKTEIETSIGLMDHAVNALRNCVVDDVHLGIRFADLLESLTSRLRTRFMHAPKGAGSGARSPAENGGNTPRPENGEKGWAKPADGFNEMNNQESALQPPISQFDSASGITTPFYPTSQSYTPIPNPLFPTGNPSNPDSLSDPFSMGTDWPGGEDFWYLPPGPAFFQNQDQSTIQTSEGVALNGHDLLDFVMGDVPSGMGSGNF